MQKQTAFLMFVGEQRGKAEEAAGFHVSLFKNSHVDRVERYGPSDG